MDDGCLAYIVMFFIIVLLISLLFQHVILPYWELFLVLGIIVCAIVWGPGLVRKRLASRREKIQNQMSEFPKKYGEDVGYFLLYLRNKGTKSAPFDKMVDDYLLHRISLSDECKKLNSLALKYGIEQQLDDPSNTDTATLKKSFVDTE